MILFSSSRPSSEQQELAWLQQCASGGAGNGGNGGNGGDGDNGGDGGDGDGGDSGDGGVLRGRLIYAKNNIFYCTFLLKEI
jgi:hypothetical protein